MVISFREANQEAEHIKLQHEKKIEVFTEAKISSFFLLHIDEALRCYILTSCKVHAFLKWIHVRKFYSLPVQNVIITCWVDAYDVIVEEADETCSMLGLYYFSFTSHSNIPHYAVYAVEVVSSSKPRIEEFCILEYNTV